MQLGIPTLIEHHSMEDAVQMAADFGFSFVELNQNFPYATVDVLKNTDLSFLKERYHIDFTVHADENLFICDFSDRVAKAHLDNMLDTISICIRHHLPLINFHMSRGIYFTLPDRKVFQFAQYKDVYLERIRHFRDACTKAAQGKVKLCIENTGLNFDFVHEGIDLLLQSPAFSLTWDIGHDFSANLADTPFLMERKEQITHMHFHDAKERDCHLPLGQGDMNLEKFLLAASPERAVLEVKTIQGIKESLPWLQAHNLM